MNWLEQQWYRFGPAQLLLYPISLLVRLLVCWRRQLYRRGILTSGRVSLPTVVVGNISVGGTGKTPFTLALAHRLIEFGWRPLIISRGYGSDGELPRRVDPVGSPREFGDEPLLMAQRGLCPVWVGRNRLLLAQQAMLVHPECDVLLCDDGLQHYRLQRDIEIAIVDGLRGLGNGQLMPAGPLREPASRLLQVDAVVVNGAAAEAGQFAMHLTNISFYSLLDPQRQVQVDFFKTQRIDAAAGIGNPQRFFNLLRQLGLEFYEHVFPDHHPFQAADLDFDTEVILLTEKDAVKCRTFADARYWVCRVEAQLDPNLVKLLLQKLTDYGRKTA